MPHTADSHGPIRVLGARESNPEDVGIEIPKRRPAVFTAPALMAAHAGERSVRRGGTGVTGTSQHSVVKQVAETAACTAPHLCGAPTPQGRGKRRVDGGR
ncbi:hypothetical protein [Kitasatospora sp. NPDC093102]|uniref:hypothetical protein n=1 Tax=Kitasatospora sp. NPDC093102 TaxID=3155069 RepID=UPI00343743B5